MLKVKCLLIRLFLGIIIMIQAGRTEEDEVILRSEIKSLVFRKGERTKGPFSYEKLDCHEINENEIFSLCKIFKEYIEIVTCHKKGIDFECESNTLPTGSEFKKTNVHCQNVDGRPDYVYKDGCCLVYTLKESFFLKIIPISFLILSVIVAILSFVAAAFGQLKRPKFKNEVSAKERSEPEVHHHINPSFIA